jgi:hypothetical protein
MARNALYGIAAVMLGSMSAFFAFYTVRLLVVTRGLSTLRAGGQGAYVGAIAFPVLALALGWGALRSWRARRPPRA